MPTQTRSPIAAFALLLVPLVGCKDEPTVPRVPLDLPEPGEPMTTVEELELQYPPLSDSVDVYHRDPPQHHAGGLMVSRYVIHEGDAFELHLVSSIHGNHEYEGDYELIDSIIFFDLYGILNWTQPFDPLGRWDAKGVLDGAGMLTVQYAPVIGINEPLSDGVYVLRSSD